MLYILYKIILTASSGLEFVSFELDNVLTVWYCLVLSVQLSNKLLKVKRNNDLAYFLAYILPYNFLFLAFHFM